MRQRRVTLFLVALGLLTLVALALTNLTWPWRIAALVFATLAYATLAWWIRRSLQTQESLLDALADVRDRIQVIACRHEAGAANMAEAYGKLTGKPGVCMVTRGPGATHASIGVHTAHQDSTPMILFVGQIALTDRGRGAFQEVDYREVFGGLAKWATEIESPERTVEVVERAFATALQGRMGPVVIALPEDILHADGGPAPIRPVTPAKIGRSCAPCPPSWARNCPMTICRACGRGWRRWRGRGFPGRCGSSSR